MLQVHRIEAYDWLDRFEEKYGLNGLGACCRKCAQTGDRCGGTRPLCTGLGADTVPGFVCDTDIIETPGGSYVPGAGCASGTYGSSIEARAVKEAVNRFAAMYGGSPVSLDRVSYFGSMEVNAITQALNLVLMRWPGTAMSDTAQSILGACAASPRAASCLASKSVLIANVLSALTSSTGATEPSVPAGFFKSGFPYGWIALGTIAALAIGYASLRRYA